MKHAILAMPAVALFSVGAFAQAESGVDVATTTDATAGAEASGESFGTNWPLSIGTTFFSGADSSTLRTTEDVTTGWQSLSQADRDMVKADCVTFMDAHGNDAASTSTDASTGAETDISAETAAEADAATAPETGTAGAEGTISTAVGYDRAEMKAICEAVEKL